MAFRAEATVAGLLLVCPEAERLLRPGDGGMKWAMPERRQILQEIGQQTGLGYTLDASITGCESGQIRQTSAGAVALCTARSLNSRQILGILSYARCIHSIS